LNTFNPKWIQTTKPADMPFRYLFLLWIFAFSTFFKTTAQLPDSTSLPLITVHMVNNDTIVDEPKRTGIMNIIYHGADGWNHPADKGNAYSGYVGIEIRGAYSATLPQKPYGFETRDSAGNNLNVPLLSLPAENDWVLFANYNDKSFLRNSIPFQLFREMGHYAPRTLHCEVIVNNQYQGIYVLSEKIKVDKNRVDIAKLKSTDITGDDLTGGYIFKTDYFDASNSWMSKYPSLSKSNGQVFFVFHDPKPEELTSQQKTYIQQYVDAFEKALYGDDFTDYRKGYLAYADLKSFVDYFIVSEVSRNVDGYKKSRYLYKNKESKGGLLHSGPVWDFDWAFKNINECIFSATDGSGWVYKAEETCNLWPLPPSWALRMMQDPYFVNQVKMFYTNYRQTILNEKHIFHYIDSVASILNKPQTRHFARWNILGTNVGAPEVDKQPASFEGEIQKLKDWIHTRLTWLDENMPGTLIYTAAEEVDRENRFRLFPNPATDQFYCETMKEMEKIELYNLSGSLVKKKIAKRLFSETMDVSDLSEGLYLVKTTLQNGEVISGKIFVKR
jgi:hypothetical protein